MGLNPMASYPQLEAATTLQTTQRMTPTPAAATATAAAATHATAAPAHTMSSTSTGEHHALCLDGVVEHILRCLPQSDRLGSCSLVCRRWHAAAVAATSEVGLLLHPCSPAAEAWLVTHGAGLQALVIRHGSVCGSSITGLAQVTRLEVSGVTSKTPLLAAIGDSLQELRHLCLVNICWGPLISSSSRDALSAAANRLWEGCSQLTHLQAEQCDLNDQCVTSLCKSLPHLVTLDLSRNSLSDGHSLGVLPAGLHSLYLGGNSEYLDVSGVFSSNQNLSGSCSSRAAAGGTGSNRRAGTQHPAGAAGSTMGCAGSSSSSSGGSSSVPMLRALDINSLTLRQPEVLAELTALTWLNVDDLAMPVPRGLLAVLPQLLQLQQLNMMGCIGGRHPPVRLPALRAALQPLTRLTALDLGNNAFVDMWREAAAGGSPPRQQDRAQQGQQLFAGLLWPRVETLGISDMCWHGGRAPLFSSADLAQLAAACPGLAWLRMHRSLALSQPSDLQPLTALSASLTLLDMDGEQQLQDEHLQSIAALQRLSCLEVSGVGDELTDRGLWALTALTALTFLRVADVTSGAVSQELLPKRGRKGSRAPSGDALVLQPKMNKHGRVTASVCQQLKEACARSPQLWRELQQELSEALDAAKKDAKQARKEAANERKKASAAQKQAREAQKQAAAAQDEVAALRQQLEALQSQLQQWQE